MFRTTSGLPIAAAAVAVATVIAACGSNSSSASNASTASSSGGHPTQAQLQQRVVSFADCMRSHGVPSFPDAATPAFKFALAPSTPHSPAFLSAYPVCQHLLPNDGRQDSARSPAQIAAFVAFARCIRSHGFPNFPDPTSTGQLTHEMVANAGINLDQPAVLEAGDACVGVTDGLITKAVVARFVAGQ